MQTKSQFVLFIIVILIVMAVIIGCIYEKQEAKGTMERTAEINETIVEIETDREVDTQATEPVSLGNFKLTGYCPCEICCGKWASNRPNGIVYGAIGEELKEGYSIAVDPDVIPYGSEVIINGKTYKAQDCGGAIKGNRIDLYFESHSDALEFGVRYAEVFKKM